MSASIAAEIFESRLFRTNGSGHFDHRHNDAALTFGAFAARLMLPKYS
jgi:hypothetical protein